MAKKKDITLPENQEAMITAILTAETPKASGDTVVVGCKLPHGLIVDLNGTSVTLNGANTSHVVGGYGMTYNVDRSFMLAWLDAFKGFEAVKRNLIFIQEKPKSAYANAKEQSDISTGLERIDPDKPETVMANVEAYKAG